MWYAVIKTTISMYLVFAFVELFLEIREIIEDKEWGIKHHPTWYTFEGVLVSTCLMIVISIVLYIWL